MNLYKNIAFIPARGGSKRLPNKNLLDFGGVSLLGLTILEAQRAKIFDRIIVSTDSEEIATEAKKWGAEVPFIRPVELAQDETTTLDVVLDYFNKIDFEFKNFFLLQTTSPLRTAEHIREAYDLFQKSEASSCVSFCENKEKTSLYYFYGQKKFFKLTELISKDIAGAPLLRLNGAIYISKKDSLINKKSFLMDDTVPFIMGEEESVDIDYREDFERALAIYKSKSAR